MAPKSARRLPPHRLCGGIAVVVVLLALVLNVGPSLAPAWLVGPPPPAPPWACVHAAQPSAQQPPRLGGVGPLAPAQAPRRPSKVAARATVVASAGAPPVGEVPEEWRVLAAASPHDPALWEEDGTVLGQGAFGIVARGMNTQTGEMAAIKRIAATDWLAIATAKNEIDAAKALGESPPNVVQMKAYFLAPSVPGKPAEMVLVYRLALGGDLQAWIARQHGTGFNGVDYAQPMLMDESLRIMIQFTDGLLHVHSKAIQHRDLKPANLLLSAGGTALIGDFGIALVNRNSSRGTPPQVCWAPLGDFYFMDTDSLCKQRMAYSLDDDVYSLGEVFVRILYGSYATGRELRTFVEKRIAAGVEPPAVTRILASLLEPRGTRCSLADLLPQLFALRYLPEGLPSEPRPIVTAAFLGIGAMVTAAAIAKSVRQTSLQRQKSVFSKRSRFQATFHVIRTQGRRMAMEEYYCHSRVVFGTNPSARSWRLLGVFDGHGGPDCAKYAARFLPHELRRFLEIAEAHHDTSNMKVPSTEDLRVVAQALQAALQSLNELFVKFKKNEIPGGNTRGFGYAGSTAAAVLLCPDGRHAVIGNLGDSRVALAGDWRVVECVGAPPQVSEDGKVLVTHPHFPGDPAEIERIEAAGGFVELGHRGHRVNGALGVSRALGYHGVKGFDKVVTATADYIIAERKTGSGRSALVALATDGVFETVGPGGSTELFGRLSAGATAEDLAALMTAELDQAGGGLGRMAENVDNATLLTCLLPPAR
eukprot:CAMPEP_0203868668 /NCGR_PEP_ID=MMETSP0359-20131031/17243_1 /ASSEMBLY_ACC=CAM_ASM_000338 /TAXON_ID=268821 /ORGANISM="Scrippsiella Hangoei, Strain SHTV-5" /LENGTH=760 /DNA_ID=CAMNT_0050787121 /DNA_START=38 /DNA_END=2320 /DNA_ORIENTATION=-